MACNFICLFETGRLLKVTGSHVYCRCGNISETGQVRDFVAIYHWEVAYMDMPYRTATIPMTLSDFQGPSPVASPFK